MKGFSESGDNNDDLESWILTRFNF